MKPDIETVADIHKVVDCFYTMVKEDDVIGKFFSEVVAINWDTHIPKMVGFWENVLFYTGDYQGDPLNTHRNIHQQHRTQTIHFERWLELFNEAVDSHYTGSNAYKMKQHAQAIASVMLSKIDG